MGITKERLYNTCDCRKAQNAVRHKRLTSSTCFTHRINDAAAAAHIARQQTKFGLLFSFFLQRNNKRTHAALSALSVWHRKHVGHKGCEANCHVHIKQANGQFAYQCLHSRRRIERNNIISARKAKEAGKQAPTFPNTHTTIIYVCVYVYLRRMGHITRLQIPHVADSAVCELSVRARITVIYSCNSPQWMLQYADVCVSGRA